MLKHHNPRSVFPSWVMAHLQPACLLGSLLCVVRLLDDVVCDIELPHPIIWSLVSAELLHEVDGVTIGDWLCGDGCDNTLVYSLLVVPPINTI